jgi:hypothetical protein
MSGALWWLPSLIVFGGAAIAAVLLVRGLRARGRRVLEAEGRTPEALDQRAGLALVQADDVVRQAEDEVGFAEAQFGKSDAAQVARAVSSARQALREAFLLRQKLDDHIPDTESDRTRWNTRIIELCATATRLVETENSSLSERRSVERDAPERLAQLTAGLAETEAALPAARATLDALARRFSPAAIGAAADAPRAAASLLAEARRSADAATDAVSRGTLAAPHLDAVARHLGTARTTLAQVTHIADTLNGAATELESSLADTRAGIAEARAARDANPLPDAADLIGDAIAVAQRAADEAETQVRALAAGPAAAGAIGAANGAMGASLPPSRADDGDGAPAETEADGGSAADAERELVPVGALNPLPAIGRLRDASLQLDQALAEARSNVERIKNAQAALRGAVFSANSYIEVAADFITSNRSRVGPEARTRLAEAERQIVLAGASADPVEALDIARRAARLAQDADALARYDAGPRQAPIRG